MAEFAQQLVVGLSSGSIYAGLALALALVYRSTRTINFAQGELGMLSTFIAWSLVAHHGWPYWGAVSVTLGLSFVGGAAVQRLLIEPVQHSVLTVVVVTLGLFVGLNGLAMAIWGGAEQSFPPGRPFPSRTFDLSGVVISLADVGTIGLSLGIAAALFAFFRFTRLGLAARAAAVNPEASRLVGVRVSLMRALGAGFAAVLGALAGLLTASSLGSFDPNLMRPVLLYGFAAAILGGLDSPLGAVLGGLLLGVFLTMVENYVSFVDSGLRLPIALAVVVGVLVLRPSGLLGRTTVQRA